MKQIKIFVAFLAIMVLTISTFAQDTTLSFRMTNPRVIRTSNTYWLQFDAQIRANTTGTYLSSVDFRISLNNAAFFVSGATNIARTLVGEYALTNIDNAAKYNSTAPLS